MSGWWKSCDSDAQSSGGWSRQPAAEAGEYGKKKPRGSRGPKSREEWECVKCGTPNFNDRQWCRINTCKAGWTAECKVLVPEAATPSSLAAAPSPRRHRERRDHSSPSPSLSPLSQRGEDHRAIAEPKVREGTRLESGSDGEAAEDLKSVKEAKLQAEAAEACLANALEARFPSSVVDMLKSEAVKARQAAEEMRPFESQLQKADARILALQRQVAQAENKNAKAQEAAEKVELKAKETYTEYVESWMHLKQLYFGKGVAVVSALMSAPRGVVGQDYVELERRAAELKALGLKQAELKDPTNQSSLAEYNELMLKAVASRRTLDAAKLRQDREGARKQVSPPPAPAAMASSEAPPAPTAPAPAVKAELKAMDIANGGDTAEEKADGKRARAVSPGGSSSSSSSPAPAPTSMFDVCCGTYCSSNGVVVVTKTDFLCRKIIKISRT